MISVLASGVRAATNNSGDLSPGGKGAAVVVDMTVVPGVQTVTPKIQALDSVSGKYIDVLVGPAIVAVSTVRLTVYPGIAVVANASASDVVLDKWRLVFTHSGAGNFTYSASMIPLP